MGPGRQGEQLSVRLVQQSHLGMLGSPLPCNLITPPFFSASGSSFLLGRSAHTGNSPTPDPPREAFQPRTDPWEQELGGAPSSGLAERLDKGLA